MVSNFLMLHSQTIFSITGALGSLVGWGTMLQARRTQVHFPMRSLIFFLSYLILRAALWPQLLTEKSTRNQTFNKETSQEFLCSGMPPSLVWTLHDLSSAMVPFKVGCPHLSICHMKYYTTAYYNPACLYLSLETAESQSDM
jgi:hypothetical protein